MYTKSQLHEQLAEMGVPQDSVVLMHISLKSVGETEGRGEGLLDALIEYCTAKGGLFCVPTHTWANLKDVDTKPTLDLNSDETCIGAFPSIAARRPDGHRSLHPTHSMIVFGDADRAEAYIKPEETNPTSTGPSGCYGQLASLGGKVLLVGVGHNRNTYLHSVEEMLDVPNRLTVKPKNATVKLKSGEIITHPLRCHNAVGIGDVSARYPKYEPAFRWHNCIVDGHVGDAPAQLCDAVGMRDVLTLVRERSGGIELMQEHDPLDEKYYK
ncbi:MAG: AAC(3) family N-acetyltransferase [Clostridia bacterium]|nr:AAC(3) family N-acetyltransferase [Clostridia bacterium]